MFTNARILLRANLQFCIEEAMSFIASKTESQTDGFAGFPQTTTSVDFCRRDITFVLNAYLRDMKNINNDAISFVSSRYWKGYLSSLVGDKQKEVTTHLFLQDLIVNYIFKQQPFPATQDIANQVLVGSPAESDADEFIISETDYLIDTIQNGLKRSFLHNKLETRITARTWDPLPLEQEKLETILECAYQAPSKNGRHEFEIYVLTDSPEGREVKRWLYEENTYCLDGVRAKQGPGLKRFNGQVNAPIVMVWLTKDYPAKLDSLGEDNFQRNDRDCIVSATMAMCQAEELNVRTGFCGCLGPKDVAAKLGKPEMKAAIIVGFGYATLDRSPTRSVSKNGVVVGWDIGNVTPSIRTYDNRKNRPSKYSMINYL